MGACIYDGKVWIFGGHGGLQYQRTSFNDLFSFDLATNNWEKINYNNAAPDGRGGHSLFAYNNKLYVYGGWNAEMQFNNVVEFDLDKREWQDNDCINDIHRWNHSSVLVEAIPTWKFFIFGGEEAEFMEGNDRQFGKFVNSSSFLDLGTMKWTSYASDPEVFHNIPAPREYSSMAFDTDNKKSGISQLIVFGGWNNGW
jgi:dynein heavy chain